MRNHYFFSQLALFIITATTTTVISTLSLHDALPISWRSTSGKLRLSFPCSLILASTLPNVSGFSASLPSPDINRSEEHTSELQSRRDLVCRLLLEKKK